MAIVLALFAWLWWLKQVQALISERTWLAGFTFVLVASFIVARSIKPNQNSTFPLTYRLLAAFGYFWLMTIAGYPYGIGPALLAIGVLLNVWWLRRLGAVNFALAISVWVIPAMSATIDAHWTIAPLLNLLSLRSGAPVTFVEGQTVWLSAQPFVLPFTLRMSFVPIWLMFVVALALYFWQGMEHWRNWLKFVGATAALTLFLSLIWSVVAITTAVTFDLSALLSAPSVWLLVAVSYAFAVAPLTKKFAFTFPDRRSPPLTRLSLASIFRLLFVVFSAALFLTCLFMPDLGKRKRGRIAFDEYHSGWEPIDVRYDTSDWRRGTGYTFNRMAFFLGKIYRVSALRQPITHQALEEVDVLILKIPTLPYEKEEVAAIKEWVKEGGGLWLIGDHTNVFGSATALNSVASTFGILFRPDAVYPPFHSLTSSHWLEWSRPPFLWHPITAGSPHLTFYTSCSLHSPLLANRVAVGAHMFSSLADYSRRNFFGEFNRAKVNRFGDYAFCIAKTFGKGRIVALGDSTFLSNFGLPEPGTWELALHTVEWLNRENAAHRKWIAVFVSAFLLIFSVFFASRNVSLPVVFAFLANGLPVAFAVAFTTNNLMSACASSPGKKIPSSKQVFFLVSDERDRRLFVGKSPHDPSENMFHEFFVSPQRIGLLPRLIRPSELPKNPAHSKTKAVLVTPIVKLKPSQVQRLIDWVSQGGRLIWLIDPSGWERPVVRDEAGVELEFAVYPFFAPKAYPIEPKTRTQKQSVAERLLSNDAAYQQLSRKLGVAVQVDALKGRDWVKTNDGLSVQCVEVAPLMMAKKGHVLGRLRNGRPVIASIRLGKGEVLVVPFALTFAREAFGASLQNLNKQQRLRHFLLFGLLG